VIICFEGFISRAFQGVEKGGTILFFSGASEGATIPVAINDIFWRTEITLTSTYAGSPEDCTVALRLIKAKTIPVKRLITNRLTLTEAGKGFEAVCTPTNHDCIKVIVEPHK